MNILLYYEGAFFGDGLLGQSSYGLIAYHLYEFTGKCLIGRPDVDFRLVMSEASAFVNADTHLLDRLNPVTLTDEDLFSVLGGGSSLETLFLRMFHSRLSAEEEGRYADLIRRKLGDWEPDVIILFPVHNEYVSRIYPKALVLNNENGMFARQPFPHSIRYEPLRYIRNFTNVYAERIGSFPVSGRETGEVAEFRTAVTGLIERFNPIRDRLAEVRSRFEKTVLLPVITGNEYEESDYGDEFAFFNGVVSAIPKDIGIIVTKHDNTRGKLNANVLPYLKEKFPNVVFADNLDSPLGEYLSPSLNYFGAVDAVLNCMTGTGLLATLWDTRIVAIDRCYSHWFSDCIGLDGLAEKLARPVRDRTSLIYWYLTHYAIFERRYTDGDWLFRFLSDKLERYRRNGLTFELFGKIEEFGDVSQYVFEATKSKLERQERERRSAAEARYREKHCAYGKIANRLEKWARKLREKAKVSCHRP